MDLKCNSKRMRLISLAMVYCFAGNLFALSLNTFEGIDIVSQQKVKVSAIEPGKKGLVVVFLSATCPCSNSHLGELDSLAKAHKNFQFLGIHSNTDESQSATRAYFENAKLPFPVIQDTKAKLAQELKAFKTPHAFLFNSQNEIVYRGGVSDSHEFSQSKEKLLRKAIVELETTNRVIKREGRTLGCAISRGNKYVW